jgi:YVTN family beta-propeller protein
LSFTTGRRAARAARRFCFAQRGGGRTALRALACASIIAVVALPAPARGGSLAFVSNWGDDTVSVIDLGTDREITTIPVGHAPQGIAIRPAPPLVAVANSKARDITLIDPERLVALPQPVHAGIGPEDVAFTPDGRELIATNYFDKTVTFTDLATDAFRGDPIGFEKIPRRLVVAPDGHELYVLLHDERSVVVVVDLATRAIAATIPVGVFASDCALTGDGTTLFTTSFDSSTVTAVDVRTRTVSRTYSVDTGKGIALHPRLPIFYSMVDFDGTVLAFDYAAEHPLGSIDIGGSPVAGAVTADGRRLYVVNSEGHHVVKIETATNSAVLRIAVGTDPAAIALIDVSPSRSVVPVVVAIAAVTGAVAVGWLLVPRRQRRRAMRVES